MSEIYYSSIRNCHRPTLIQNGPQIGSATLKNSPTLFSSAPCRDVCDAYLRRRLFSIFSILHHFTNIFLLRAQRGKCFGVDPVWTLKKCAMLKKSARSAENFFIYRYFQRKMKDLWRFSVVSEVLYFSLKINLWKCMMLGPTLIRSRPKIGYATLKNCTTLIQFQPRQELYDAYFQRRQFPSDEYFVFCIWCLLHVDCVSQTLVCV